MGAYGWGTDGAVGDWLFEEGYRFDFYQAVRLLEAMFPDTARLGETADPHSEPVRFVSEPGFDFPGADIAEIRRSEGGDGEPPVTMRVNFMGLGGQLGPLPGAYTEVLHDQETQRDEDGRRITGFRDFLDIFNHRLVTLLYRVRKQHHIGLAMVPPVESPVASYLFALMGLGTPGLRGRLGVDDRVLLRYGSLLAQQPRSAVGLEGLLSDFFHVPVRLQQFAGRWHALSARQTTRLASPFGKDRATGHPLARNNGLAQSVVLGSRVWKQADGVSVHVGPLPLPTFLDFLPDGTAHRSLGELTRFYVDDATDFNFVLQLSPDAVPSSRLSMLAGPRLGWTSWLTGSPDVGSTGDGAPSPVIIAPRLLSPELQRLRVPLLEALPRDQFQHVQNEMERRSLQEGRVIAREGDAADAFFVINAGAVHVLRTELGKGQVLLATLTEGDTFGEIAFEDDKRYPTTFVTAEPCNLLALTHERLRGIMAKYPAIERAVDVYRRRFLPDPGEAQRLYLARVLLGLRCPLFGDLPIEGFYELAGEVAVAALPTGAVLVEEGTYGDAFFLIQDGTAMVRSDRADRPLSGPILHRGDYFGEGPLLTETPYPATVVALSPLDVIVLTRGALQRVVARYPPLERAIRLFYHHRSIEAVPASHDA